jgi:hypothetical protein
MKEDHQHRNVTEKEWSGLILIIRESLDNFKIPRKEQDEVITWLAETQGEIVFPATEEADK